MKLARCFVVGFASLALAACAEEPQPVVKPVVPQEPPINLSYQEIPPVSKDYKVTACVVCGKEFATLGHPPMAIAYKGYEARVCDKNCLRGFASDPQGIILRKINPRAMFDK
jgi:hypothetical protein